MVVTGEDRHSGCKGTSGGSSSQERGGGGIIYGAVGDN